MTTLRDIITEDREAIWEDNSGDQWDCDNLLEQWGDDLDRSASCVDSRVQWIGADGYIQNGEAVLREVAPGGSRRELDELYERVKTRLRNHPTLNEYREVILDYDWTDEAQHWTWAATAPEHEIIDWAESIEAAQLADTEAIR